MAENSQRPLNNSTNDLVRQAYYERDATCDPPILNRFGKFRRVSSTNVSGKIFILFNRLSSVRLVLIGALALFALLAMAYLGSIELRASRNASITGDEPFYLLTTQSLLHDGDLDLSQQYQQGSYQSFFDPPDGLWKQSAQLDNGVLLSPHNPGLSIMLIPGYAIGGLRGTQVQLLLIAAFTFALTYILVARITEEYLWGWLAVAVVGLSAIAFVYATEVYPEMPAAFLLIASLLVLQSTGLTGDKRALQDDRKVIEANTSGRSDPVEGCSTRTGLWFDKLATSRYFAILPLSWRALLLATLLTAMLWLGVKYAPLAGLVTLWALWRMEPGDRIALLISGVVSAVFFTWFHLRTYGTLTPYSVGLVYAGEPALAVLAQHFGFADRAYRLIGLFIDQRFGIGHWAPVLLIALPATGLLRRGGSVSRLVLALIGAQLLIATFLAVTMMGWWFPGRTMITVLPLFALPMALLLMRLPTWGRLAVGLMGLHTLAITAALVIAGHTNEITIAVDPFNMKAPLFQVISPIFPDYRHWTIQTWLLTGVWSLAAVCTAAWAFNLPLSLGRAKLRRLSNYRAWVRKPGFGHFVMLVYCLKCL